MRLPATLVYTGLTLTTLGAFTYASRPVQHPLKMSDQNQAPTVATSSSPLLLSDTLATQRSLSIFSSLARDDQVTSSTFSTKTGYTVVLAPVNSAIKALSHKPWEDPEEAKAQGGAAYRGEDGMDRANRNLQRWVQGCLVAGEAGQEWKEGQKRSRGMEKGAKKEVWWEVKNGKQVIMPEGFVVQGVLSRAANGEVWALEGTFEN